VKRAIISFVAGGLFGAGLVVSQMTNPAKIIAFLDIFGAWDPSLAFVMAGAILVTFFGYRYVLGKSRPLFDQAFHLPDLKTIDGKLVGGAALFGMGWGLSGLCPGPAISLSTFGGVNVLYFLTGLIISIAGYRIFLSKSV